MKKAKFGPGGNSALFSVSGYRSSIYAPEWVRKMELDAYEYECGNGVSGSEETFAEIGLNAVHHGVAMSLHAPYYISLSGIVPEKRLGSIRYIMQSVHAAECMGAKTIVVHAGSASKIDRKDAMKLAEDTLRQALDEYSEYASQNGCKVKIGLETMGKINQLGTLEEITQLCKIDPCFVPVVDFGHLYARSCGTDMITTDSIKRVFDTVYRELGASVAEELHCHFSCIQYSNGGESKHLTFDNGQFGPDPKLFINAIVSLGVSPVVICESAGTQDIDAAYLKRLYMEAV